MWQLLPWMFPSSPPLWMSLESWQRFWLTPHPLHPCGFRMTWTGRWIPNRWEWMCVLLPCIVLYRIILTSRPWLEYLDGFGSFNQTFTVHFLHGCASLWRFGKFHKCNSFGLFCLFIFYQPYVLDFPKHRKMISDVVLSDGFAGY